MLALSGFICNTLYESLNFACIMIPKHFNLFSVYALPGCTKASGNVYDCLIVQSCWRQDPWCVWKAGCQELSVFRTIANPEVPPAFSFVHHLWNRHGGPISISSCPQHTIASSQAIWPMVTGLLRRASLFDLSPTASTLVRMISGGVVDARLRCSSSADDDDMLT